MVIIILYLCIFEPARTKKTNEMDAYLRNEIHCRKSINLWTRSHDSSTYPISVKALLSDILPFRRELFKDHPSIDLQC